MHDIGLYPLLGVDEISEDVIMDFHYKLSFKAWHQQLQMGNL
jgi:hypothetical protein